MSPGITWLADLVRRVPVLVVPSAGTEGISARALRDYGVAVERWREEAALALREAEADQSSHQPDQPDAYCRIANVLALSRLEAAE